MEENTENPVDTAKELRGKPFINGFDPRRNLDGRPEGKKNYDTEMNEAIVAYAKLNSLTPEEVKIRIYMKGAGEALKGSFPFFKDFMDRTHGSATQKIDANVEVTKRIMRLNV